MIFSIWTSFGNPLVSKNTWCDVAFSHPEIPVRLKDAQRACGENERNIVCVVIDVLRATTNIAAILENGCSAIHPCASPEIAFELAQKLRLLHGPEKIILGGEQDGKPIEGFDGGNSPLEYTRRRISGKTLILSTSNGTKTLSAVQRCGEIFTAAFVNITATAERVASILHENPDQSLLIACSGREGAYCEEDTAGAGMLLQILSGHLEKLEFSDTARAALHVANGAEKNLEKMLFQSWWGRHLSSLGLDEDISFCAQKDIMSIVPRLDDGVIRIA